MYRHWSLLLSFKPYHTHTHTHTHVPLHPNNPSNGYKLEESDDEEGQCGRELIKELEEVETITKDERNAYDEHQKAHDT